MPYEKELITSEKQPEEISEKIEREDFSTENLSNVETPNNPEENTESEIKEAKKRLEQIRPQEDNDSKPEKQLTVMAETEKSNLVTKIKKQVEMALNPSNEYISNVIGTELPIITGATVASLFNAPFSQEIVLATTAHLVFEAFMTLKNQKRYGEHLSVNLVTPSQNLHKTSGELLVSKGQEKIAEIHFNSNKNKMARQLKNGRTGVLKLELQGLKDLKALSEQARNESKFENVRYLTANSNVGQKLLTELGFENYVSPTPSLRQKFVSISSKLIRSAMLGKSNSGKNFYHKYTTINNLISDNFKNNLDEKIKEIETKLGERDE